jgi:hypothetical protein
MMMIAMMMTIAIHALAMTFHQARSEALFLSDKMAYELNLTDEQYAAVYEINLDYLMSISDRGDLYGNYWARRNADLQYVLDRYQYLTYSAASYFYRPVSLRMNGWAFGIYRRYCNHAVFYRPRPAIYISYRGGNNRFERSYYAHRNIARPQYRMDDDRCYRGNTYGNGTQNYRSFGNQGNAGGNRNYRSYDNRGNSSGRNWNNGNTSRQMNNSNRGFGRQGASGNSSFRSGAGESMAMTSTGRQSAESPFGGHR